MTSSDGAVDDLAVERGREVDVDALIAEYDAEQPARRLTGPVLLAVSVVAAGLSLYALYRVFAPQNALQYRMIFLAVVLPLTFLVYRPGRPLRERRLVRAVVRRIRGPATEEAAAAPTGRRADRPTVTDWVLAAVALVACAYPLFGFDAFLDRAFAPRQLDVLLGALLVVLVLEATRRTCGPMLPLVCLLFLLYAYYGGYLPISWLIGHPGYDVDRIVEQLYMGTEGLFGVPLDVAATYIVLFTIYGAVLDLSGAGQFFVRLSFATFRRSRAAPGRTVTLAGFLLGTVSGSGTATAVGLGSVSWPILRRAGYPQEQAGGVLAAAGIGAILSPPTLGAAAFIIAEFLRISYLQVLLFALVPTLLYYLGILLAVEMDARRFGARPVDLDLPSAWRLLARFGYHFSSLVAIVVFMAAGTSPFRAVVYATILAFALSFLDRSAMLTPRRAFEAMRQGSMSVLPVAAACAASGTIVGVTTLTGLGQNLSAIILDVADNLSWNATTQLAFTALLAAVAIVLLGLAVPVTASFIIAAVIIAPALTALGISTPEAYMFIFYYAVLSEVSPPTALAAMAAAAITGGRPIRTMVMAWKYTLPAFLVPFAFVLAPAGDALLGQAPWPRIVLATAISMLAVVALAVVTGRWMLGPANWPERACCAVAAVLLLYLEPTPVLVGCGLLAVALALHLAGRGRSVDAPTEGIPDHA